MKVLGTAHTIPNNNSFFTPLSDNRGLLSRIYDATLAAFKEMGMRRQRRYNPMLNRVFPVAQKTEEGIGYHFERPWTNGRSKELVVLIHGLRSSPLTWSKYLAEFDDADEERSYFAPHLYKKGYASVDEVATPILKEIQLYKDQYPDNRVILIGHSYGALTAGYIEQRLPNARNVHLISIAGPHCGTNMVNWMERARVGGLVGFTPRMTDEMRFQGSWATRHLIDWQAKKDDTDNTNTRHFFATADDWRVFPAKSSFPNLPNSSYCLVSRESHVTIVEAVKDDVFAIIRNSLN